MIRGLVEGMLGPIGTQVLDFYIANSLVINSVVLVYGLVMLLSWTNTVNIRKRLLYAMLVQMTNRSDITGKTKVNRILNEINIPWEEAIEQARFPLVSPRGGLRPHPKTVETVKEIISAEDLAHDALMMISGQNKTMHRRPGGLRRKSR